jgi:hypothetical protein
VNNPATTSGTPDRYHSAEIFDALRGVEYGSIEIVIHDSEVVQIIRKQRVRFDSKPGPEGG